MPRNVLLLHDEESEAKTKISRFIISYVFDDVDVEFR
jgi:hypothetical protein